VNRDIRFDKEYPGDLRNRIVGSRIIKDGGSPYFYKWKKGSGFRYYDPNNFDAWRPSITASTPFLHQLLTPLVEMPQARISKWWLVIEYLMLTAMVLLFLGQARTTRQKQAVLLVGLLFLLTNAWERHTSFGETYLCIPFFATLFYVCWRKIDKPLWAAAAGIAAASLVLVRTNTLLFFIPFIFLVRNIQRRSLVAFFLPVTMLAGWTLLDRHELYLWQDYSRMLSEQIRIHQGLEVPRQQNDPDPKFSIWEEVDMQAADELIRTDPVTVYSENGNAFVIYEHLFHRKLPVPVLYSLALLVIVCLAAIFYYLRRSGKALDAPHTAIFGFCLYMISDLFSPVHRHQYYTVQWLFPLLLAAALFSRPLRSYYILLLTALLLNCVHLPIIKMGNTIGEYLMLAVLLAISLRSNRRAAVNTAWVGV
jgi:hypothetical protein